MKNKQKIDEFYYVLKHLAYEKLLRIVRGRFYIFKDRIDRNSANLELEIENAYYSSGSDLDFYDFGLKYLETNREKILNSKENAIR